MAAIDYLDGYLAPLIENKPEWEARARQDVAAIGTFPEYWYDRLTMYKVYITCCLESMAREDDEFAVKLREYRTEFKDALAAARIATQTPPPGFESQRPFLSIPLLRS